MKKFLGLIFLLAGLGFWAECVSFIHVGPLERWLIGFGISAETGAKIELSAAVILLGAGCYLLWRPRK